ncbi:transposase [Pseudoalteromonas rubra]|uniref:Transposase n=1 Tax=Pseudoalteromonas rubra TaxID=43658 RepID=A0A7S7YTW0_9GAMM|nr:transposase [Pseudoalteromonas rubra]
MLQSKFTVRYCQPHSFETLRRCYRSASKNDKLDAKLIAHYGAAIKLSIETKARTYAAYGAVTLQIGDDNKTAPNRLQRSDPKN